MSRNHSGAVELPRPSELTANRSLCRRQHVAENNNGTERLKVNRCPAGEQQAAGGDSSAFTSGVKRRRHLIKEAVQLRKDRSSDLQREPSHGYISTNQSPLTMKPIFSLRFASSFLPPVSLIPQSGHENKEESETCLLSRDVLVEPSLIKREIGSLHFPPLSLILLIPRCRGIRHFSPRREKNPVSVKWTKNRCVRYQTR